MIGLGIDAVEIERFRQVLARRPSIIERLFTSREQSFGRSFPDPTSRLAARFAAKEAAMKAMGVGLGSVSFRDIEVVRSDDGRPHLELSGSAAELAREQGIRTWHVSITHTEVLAEAVVAAS